MLNNLNFNLTRSTFIFFAATVGIMSILIHSVDKYLPLFLKKSFRYGKYSEKQDHVIVRRLEVPKRWFGHFYLFAAPSSTLIMIVVINRYFYDGDVPRIVYSLLDLQLGSPRKALVSPENTLIAIVLLTIQCWKRLYETHCVSIFSDAKINLSHYIVGFVHYIGTLTCIIGESEGFVEDSRNMFLWEKINPIVFIWASIFLLASFIQLRSNFILANLRKHDKKNVVVKSYKIPRTGMFEYISSPLQFTEIIMYFMLTIILWNASTYHYVFLWVLINQTETAISSHRWYKQTFKNYPQLRKTLIPFIY